MFILSIMLLVVLTLLVRRLTGFWPWYGLAGPDIAPPPSPGGWLCLIWLACFSGVIAMLAVFNV